MEPFLCERRVVPVTTERERLVEASFVERLQQIVDDLVAQAGDRDLDVAPGRDHDDGGVRKPIANLRREPETVAPAAAEPDVADGDVADLFVECRERVSRAVCVTRVISQSVSPRARLLPQRDLVIDDEDGRGVERRSCAHDADGLCGVYR